jgi:hypothetical protein
MVREEKPLEMISTSYPTGEDSFDAYLRAILVDAQSSLEEHGQIPKDELHEHREAWLIFIRDTEALFQKNEEGSSP